MHKFCRITALLLSLVFLLLSLAGCASAGSPLKYLKDCIKKNIDESLAGELLSFLLQTAQNGSIAIEFGGTDLVEELPDSAKLSLWLNAEERLLAGDGALVLDGARYDAAFWLSNQKLVLNSPAFLGSTTVGVEFSTLSSDLKTSIFSNNSGTAYARPEVSEASADLAIGLKDGIFDLLNSSDEAQELLGEAINAFLVHLTTNAYNNRYRESGRTYVALTVDNNALSRALREARLTLVGDRAFCKELRKLANTLDAIETAKNGVVTTEHITKVEYFISSEADIEEICLKIDTAAPFSFALNATVRNFGRRLEELTFTHTVDGATYLSFAANMATGDGLNTFSYAYQGITRCLTYQVKEDSMRRFGADMTYTKSNASDVLLSATASLQADRKNDSFTFTVTRDGTARSFGGNYALSSKEFSLSLTHAAVNGEAKRLSLSLVATPEAAQPAAPDFVNLIKIDTTRYAPMDERIKSTKESLEGAWQPLEITPHSLLADVLTVLGLEEEIPPVPEEIPEE